ncbi:hypothetical protein DSO57_1025263 [Entomophthora muscae]|uniref:Uncharacterized protein n=1 Tax=Entomophthora muscae TaxID=34485 RepID=A0ACC2SRJ6_9FUNG|nr:hypothetical protein DSO57_1025263 [Entomophthora muscae]
MEPPVTPKPMPASAAKLPLDHTNKLFGGVYITLTRVIDTIIPTTGLWSWLGKSMSYLIKLAPILWWALPTQSATHQFPDASKPASQGWFPDRLSKITNANCKITRVLLALDRDIFSRAMKKAGHIQVQPLRNLEDLTNIMEKHFVLVFTTKTSPFLRVPSHYREDINPIKLFALLVLSCFKITGRTTKNVDLILLVLSGLRLRKLGDKIPHIVEFQSSNPSGPGVPQSKENGSRNLSVMTSKENINVNVVTESSECVRDSLHQNKVSVHHPVFHIDFRQGGLFHQPSSSTHILHSRNHNQEDQVSVVGDQEENHT